MEEIQTSFGDRINRFCENKIFISSFITFQYKCSVERLNPKSKIHKSVIEILEKHGLYKTLENPLEKLKEKDKKRDKDKEKENKNQHLSTIHTKSSPYESNSSCSSATSLN